MCTLGIVGEIGEANTEGTMKEYYIWTHKKFEIGYNGEQIVDVNLTSESKTKLVPNSKVAFTYEVIVPLFCKVPKNLFLFLFLFLHVLVLILLLILLLVLVLVLVLVFVFDSFLVCFSVVCCCFVVVVFSMFKLATALDSKHFSSVNELLASNHFVRSFGLQDSQLAVLKLHLHTVAYSLK